MATTSDPCRRDSPPTGHRPEAPDPVAAVAAVADPMRRRIYDCVRQASGPLGRDDVAAELGIPRSKAAFHLDRLVEERLLAVEYRRLNGLSGPGSGRPAKLYAAVLTDLQANVPHREYDLAADLLARAIDEAAASGERVDGVLARVASEAGAELAGNRGDLQEVLAEHGYRPRVDTNGNLELLDCPFHRLSARHTQTICAMNLALVSSLAGTCGSGFRAEHVDPRSGSGHCCVRLKPTDAQPVAGC